MIYIFKEIRKNQPELTYLSANKRLSIALSCQLPQFNTTVTIIALNCPARSAGGVGYFAAFTAAKAAVSNIGLPLLVATLDSEATESCNLN